ncbi:MAG: magnesium transporter MgtE N-terminal domain-containing protein [Streptosporangiaceae bacterium]
MNTRHRSRISRKAAEQLLDGATGLGRSHAKAPGGPDQLARVLAAAAAPGREHELAGEQMAVAAFEASHLESVASYQRGQMIKSPLAKIVTTKVLAATLTVFAGGGVALAASTGTFSGSGPATSQTPGPVVSSTSAPAVGPVVAPSVSVSATPTGSGPASSADPLSSADPQSSASTSSAAATSSPSTVPQTAAALCHALISDANGTSSQQLSQGAQVAALASGAAPNVLSSNSEFAPLIGTAQSAAAVPDYCALLLDLPQLPQPSELVQLPTTVLSQLLTQLPTGTLSQDLTSLPSSTLSTVLTELPSSTVTQLLNELPTSTVTQLLNELPASVLSVLSGLSGLSGSVASLLPGL